MKVKLIWRTMPGYQIPLFEKLLSGSENHYALKAVGISIGQWFFGVWGRVKKEKPSHD